MTDVCPICDGLGCSDCMPELAPVPNPAHLAYARALDEAAADGGPVVARVFCARCGDSGTLATVRRHPRWGLYFEARIVRAVERTAELRHREDDLRRRTGGRVPRVAAGLCRHLLDFPAVVPAPYFDRTQRQDGPQAECPRCGVDALDRDELKTAAGSRNGPGIVTIHRGATVTV